ncbi:MAG: AEC family transporter [Clostridia bacterium]|nr:AEC family transporter [Clostridia bacterium]MBR2877995.1 AEC family transporter [Clostridia bacterium]MBR2972615.1 AEC family transporter [Clostridia bacterium]
MNHTFISALSATLVLFFFIISGYILRKTNAVPKNSAAVFSAVLMHFFIPVLILYVMTQNITPEIIAAQKVQLITSTVIIIVSCVLAYVIASIMDKGKSKKGVYTFTMAFPNFAFMGIPIVEAVYGPEAFSTLILFILPYYILVNVLGDIIIRDEKLPRFSTLVSPITISIVLGFGLVYARVPIPQVVVNQAHIIYSSAIPLSMMLMGFVLAGKKITSMFTALSTYFISAMRLILFPMITLIALWLVGLRGMALGVPVLILGMPTAVNGVMLAENAGKDAFHCSSVVFISTLLSLLTIPMLSYIVTLF